MPEEIAQNITELLTAATRGLSGLGERIDGWADLVEGAGDRALDVASAFHERISARQMPDVTHESANLSTSSILGRRRPYQLIRTPTGATLAVYIGSFGKDLYISWDLFIRTVWNMTVIWGILGSAAFLGLFSARETDLWGRSSFSFSSWIISTIGLSILFAFLVACAGFMLRRGFFGFFVKELDFFDADDITAMALAVHKSLLQAADTVGIDIHLLRVKEQFRGGRRDRLI